MPLPEPVITFPAHFQATFTSPTWQKAVGLLVGTLLTRGLRTVTIALRRMGLQEMPQFSNYHHLLAPPVGRDVCTGMSVLSSMSNKSSDFPHSPAPLKQVKVIPQAFHQIQSSGIMWIDQNWYRTSDGEFFRICRPTFIRKHFPRLWLLPLSN